MRSTDPDAAFAVLRAADPDVMDRDELAELARQIASHKAWCDSLQVRVTRRQRQLETEGRGEAPADLLAREGGQSGRDARTADEREQVCSSLSNFEDALTAGEVTAGHVDAIAAAIKHLDDVTAAEFFTHRDELLDKAHNQGVDVFGRSCRDLARQVAAEHAAGSEVSELDRQRAASTVKRWIDRETGMRHTLISLDPVRDQTLWNAARAAIRKVRNRPEHAKASFDQLQVEGVLAACNGGEGAERVPAIIALIDHDTLRSGLHAKSVCEASDGTAIPVDVVRRLACDAEIIPVVLNGRGQALDVGRAQRLATPAQRAALRAMHRTCIGPTCTVPFDDCQIHHIVPFERGGRTDLANMAPLCTPEHGLVHEGGWTLTMTPDRIATWIRPDGAIHRTGPTIDRAPNGVAIPPAA